MVTKRSVKRAKKTVRKQSASQAAARKSKPVKPAKATVKTAARRADFGAPVASFFAKQPPHLKPILDELRKMVEAAAPSADASLKWGMPFYSLAGQTVCALGAHKAHVNLILSGPPGTYDDPKGLLIGDGKTGRHLKITAIDDLPRAEVKAWLKKAVQVASGKK